MSPLTVQPPLSESAPRERLHAPLLAVERAQQTAVASERQILAAAQDRLQHVQTELTALRRRALSDSATGERYLALIQERGQLQQTLALAERHLKHGWD